LPDELILKGFETLFSAGVLDCKQISDCRLRGDFHAFPPLAGHLHTNQDLTISFLKESEPFCSLSRLDLQVLNGDIILASDPRPPLAQLGRGQGAFPSHLYPVRIPTAPRYTEVIIQLSVRDRSHHFHHSWMALLTYMLEYVDGSAILQEDYLESQFRPFYYSLKSGDANWKVTLDELEEVLKSQGTRLTSVTLKQDPKEIAGS
jgi:hypothetical protein